MADARGKSSSRGKSNTPPRSAPKSGGGGGDSGRPASMDSTDSGARNEPDSNGRLPGLPELMRRALTIGLSGFFFTEEAIRKALGDTLPKDWTDFAVDQSERTRREFFERLSYEMAQTFENIDLAAVLRDLLEGRTLEINAEVRLRAPDESGAPGSIRIGLKQRDPKK